MDMPWQHALGRVERFIPEIAICRKRGMVEISPPVAWTRLFVGSRHPILVTARDE
jgi:hypothetical protein